MTTHSKKANDDKPRTRPLSTSAGAAMGVGVGAALTAATGDGWWIGAFAGFGALVARSLACSQLEPPHPGEGIEPAGHGVATIDTLPTTAHTDGELAPGAVITAKLADDTTWRPSDH